MFKWTLLSMLILITVPYSVVATSKDSVRKVQSATVFCGGNHAFARRNSQAHRSIYILRNLSDRRSISIDRIRFYTADGNVAVEYTAPDLPVFINRVLGSGDTVLAPHETAQFRSQEIFGDVAINRRLRPLQMSVDWSSDEDVLSLQVSHVRTVSQAYEMVDPMTGIMSLVIGPEDARHSSGCWTVKAK